MCKLSQHPAIHADYMLHHCNVIIMFPGWLGRSEIVNPKNNDFTRVTILHEDLAAARSTWPAYVGGRKRENNSFFSEKSNCCCINIIRPYRRSVQFWLLRNLSLGGKLCFRDGRNAAFVSRRCEQAWT